MAEQQRTALITGGAKRVGRAIVEHLAKSGYDIAFTYLGSADEARSLEQLVKAAGRVVVPVQVDLTAAAAADVVYAAVAQKFSRLDLLVNNASTFAPGGLRESNPELLDKLFAIHVRSPLLLCQRFETMLRSARGCVINMVDLLAERPWPQYAAYCASKAALWNLTLSLARELAPEVRVNGIAPGAVEWPEDYSQQDREKYLKRVPLGRVGSPQEVANLVHFLAVQNSYITGQIIRLDGGRSIV